MPRGISVHVGVNTPDPGFNVTPLQGCVSDANSMRDIAESRGFEAIVFADGNATFGNVSAAIRNAAGLLTAGDIFLFTFAGHGSFRSTIPSNDEGDGQAETILLRDCVLIDNFLRRNLWSQFSEGVRILGIADSCHSDTVFSTSSVDSSAADPSAFSFEGKMAGGVRAFTDTERAHIESWNPELHTTLRNSLLSNAAATVRASILTLAACRDNEDALDGPEHGAFTQALLDVWNDGAFIGTYDDFITGIRGRFTPDQQRPGRRPEEADIAFLQQQPFTI